MFNYTVQQPVWRSVAAGKKGKKKKDRRWAQDASPTGGVVA